MKIRANWSVYIALFGILFLLAVCSDVSASNCLVTGRTLDKIAPLEPVTIDLFQPCVLNYKSRLEIFEARTKIVNRRSILLKNLYVPSAEVFDGMEDHRPWWGVQGACLWGPGNKSIEGPSEESRFLMNPFLLVGANSGTCNIWDINQIDERDLDDKTFPYFWLPESLLFYPSQALMQIKYNVTKFNQELAKRGSKLIVPIDSTTTFGLIAYNARDFGFNYIYLDTTKSFNIKANISSDHPTHIVQMIHCGNTCQFPGGCNNMSPAQPEIDQFECTALPAHANIKLWKENPTNKDCSPDLTVYMDLH